MSGKCHAVAVARTYEDRRDILGRAVGRGVRDTPGPGVFHLRAERAATFGRKARLLDGLARLVPEPQR